MAHLKQTTFIKVAVDTLNDIVRDPHRAPEYWVGMSGPHRAFGDGGPGTKAEFTLEMMGRRQRLDHAYGRGDGTTPTEAPTGGGSTRAASRAR